MEATTVREPRPEKVAVVDEVEARLASSSATLLTEYRGLPVKELELLRRAVRSAGGEYKVYKNTLVRRAIVAGGHEGIEALLTGPTGMVFVDGDVVAVAKALREFSRANPALIVKGGIVGKDILDERRAAALAELPSREALLAQIAGLLAAPMQRFAGLLQALPLNMAYALKALIDSKGGVPAEVVEAAVEEPVAEAPATEAATEDGAPEAAEAEATADDAAPAAESESAEAEATADHATPAAESEAAEPEVATTAEPEAAEADTESAPVATTESESSDGDAADADA